jgi:hypothetical protein
MIWLRCEDMRPSSPQRVLSPGPQHDEVRRRWPSTSAISPWSSQQHPTRQLTQYQLTVLNNIYTADSMTTYNTPYLGAVEDLKATP